MTFTTKLISTFSFVGLALCANLAQAQVTGTGSTLVRELMSSWASQFGARSGGVRYEPTGSPVAISKTRDGSVDFGVTDIPLTTAALQQYNIKQVPLAAAGVAFIVNLPELNGKSLRLTGDILADIFYGNITQWNHSLIVANNPGVELPAKPIIPIWRSDTSGQSYVVTTYLARGSSKWRRNPGVTTDLSLSVGKGVRGGSAVVAAMKETPGSIGYEGFFAAQKAGYAMVELLNASGSYVKPSNQAIQEALTSSTWNNQSNTVDLDGIAGAKLYPMTTVAYGIIKNDHKGANPLLFMQAAVASGDEQVRQLGLVPLPPAAKTLVAQMR